MSRPRPVGFLVAVAAAILASTVATPVAAATDPSTRPAQPVTYTAEAGGVHQLTHPGEPWPGVDDFGCRPTAEHASVYADPQTLDLTLNALDPEGAVTPRCAPTAPVIGVPGEVPPRG